MKFKQLLSKTTKVVKKHSPAILTGAGIVGLGVTAVLAYKSREKVEAVVVDIEEKRQDEVEIDKVQVAKDLTEALYLPIIVGTASMTAILMSYRIQNNRIATLATALAAQQAQNMYFEAKYRKQHGDEAYNQFMVPTEDIEKVEMVKGKEKITVTQVKSDVDHTIGQWYDESSEYASDDHTYNVAFIDSVNDRLQTILFQRGSLMLNEVREALGFERIRAGALLGWTTQDNFNVEKVVTNLGDEEMGELKQQIWVTWTRPRYIYEEVDFNGRYSIHG